jgi:O-acetylhomoserine/O-acetylserine sulfhydrylase-like pyridoxal-dependent enzyme
MSDHKSVPVSLLDLGVTEKLIRLAVGIECIDDIMLDVQTAL